jgi:hypothetical protein
MLCFTAGYINNKNFNEHQVYATCTVISSQVVSDRCSYSCNCDSKGQNCATCYYTCYNGWITVSIPAITQGTQVDVVDHLQTSNDVTLYLQNKYPLGSSFGCYYNNDVNTTGTVQVQLGLKDYITSYNVGLAFGGIAAVAVLIFIVLMAYGFLPLLFECIGDSFANCCGNIRRHKDQRRAVREGRRRVDELRKQEAAQQKKIEAMEAGKLQESERSSVSENDISSTPGSPVYYQPQQPPPPYQPGYQPQQEVQPEYLPPVSMYDMSSASPLASAPPLRQSEINALPTAPPLSNSELIRMNEQSK